MKWNPFENELMSIQNNGVGYYAEIPKLDWSGAQLSHTRVFNEALAEIEEHKAVIHESTCMLCGGTGKIPSTHPLATGCSKCSRESRCPYCAGTGMSCHWTSKAINA